MIIMMASEGGPMEVRAHDDDGKCEGLDDDGK